MRQLGLKLIVRCDKWINSSRENKNKKEREKKTGQKQEQQPFSNMESTRKKYLIIIEHSRFIHSTAHAHPPLFLKRKKMA
jgi:hypothetical protein